MLKGHYLLAAIAATTFSALAQAEDFYLSGNIGYSDMDNVSTSGSFSSDFTTGPGTDIPAGTVLPAGTDVGLNTSVDSGSAIGFSLGWQTNQLRFEVEFARVQNDVESHRGVSASDIPLGGEDAGVLVSGAPDNLGISVSELVASGQGEFRTDYLFLNVLYEFATDWVLNPYIGAGIGNAWVDVDYSPSGVAIIDDDDSVLAHQLMAGLDYELNQQLSFYGGLRWRQTDKVEVDADLFDAQFEVEVDSLIAEIGTRWLF
ncbi:outer membrane beta-barrel protein [Microbulbifer sp. 2201CG32-9]|uniref:outer membrane beta-barrel protein n=1 Tax=Microbulbifer sp. 2201CG32-9 TaxID=3232309 RepID=UPI00345BBFDB